MKCCPPVELGPWCVTLFCAVSLPPLALRSLTFVEELVGVAVLELLGDRDSPPRVVEEDNGEAVPEVESFFLEDLLESFALESCSCYPRISDQFRHGGGGRRSA